jgi:hypothetical protein
VLSIGRIVARSEEYYVADGGEEYSRAPGCRPGFGSAKGPASRAPWLRGTERPPPGAHRRLAQWRDPDCGPGGRGSRVAGSDLTWSAPKSVSLLFGLSVPGVTAIIRGVHKDAVDKRSATSIVMPSKLRRAAGGQNSVAAEGLVAAASRIGPRRPNPSTQLVAATERSTLDPT